MSKLYSKFLDLKQKDPDTLYLFKSGIFYMALNEDANRLSDLLNLKVTRMTDELSKCCFPVSKSDYYFKILNSSDLIFKIIDSTSSTSLNYNEYKNNESFKEVISKLLKLDINNMSYAEAYLALGNCIRDLKDIIYKDGGTYGDNK